jgi:hypothetical protein
MTVAEVRAIMGKPRYTNPLPDNGPGAIEEVYFDEKPMDPGTVSMGFPVEDAVFVHIASGRVIRKVYVDMHAPNSMTQWPPLRLDWLGW